MKTCPKCLKSLENDAIACECGYNYDNDNFTNEEKTKDRIIKGICYAWTGTPVVWLCPFELVWLILIFSIMLSETVTNPEMSNVLTFFWTGATIIVPSLLFLKFRSAYNAKVRLEEQQYLQLAKEGRKFLFENYDRVFDKALEFIKTKIKKFAGIDEWRWAEFIEFHRTEVLTLNSIYYQYHPDQHQRHSVTFSRSTTIGIVTILEQNSSITVIPKSALFQCSEQDRNAGLVQQAKDSLYENFLKNLNKAIADFTISIDMAGILLDLAKHNSLRLEEHLAGLQNLSAMEIYFSEITGVEFYGNDKSIGKMALSIKDGRTLEIGAYQRTSNNILEGLRQSKRQQNTYQGQTNSERMNPVEIKEKMGNLEKVCPMCAENVKAAAKICRFCRYEFKDC